ncbi:MAG: hypothetical protein GDA39_00840 [Hyphomonadaceae bacterium]|nr:hypothetical protein [Hyphomonadaceae bacterium]MBC6411556.1 hypothetical protein [Hyphomonadaceae bacterium]
MMNLLFSPRGRVNPQEFMKGMRILIVGWWGPYFLYFCWLLFLKMASGDEWAGLLVTPLWVEVGVRFQIVSALYAILLAPLGWAWVWLWVKRYRDAGKYGWWLLIPLGVVGIFNAFYLLISCFIFAESYLSN